jgi:hypothetical protein
MANCFDMISFDVKFTVRPWKTFFEVRNRFFDFICSGFRTFRKLPNDMLNRWNIIHFNDTVDFHPFKGQISDLNVLKMAQLGILIKPKWYLLCKLASWRYYFRRLMLNVHLLNAYHSDWRLKAIIRFIWYDFWTLPSGLFDFSLFHCGTDIL